jgi:hypothetical protein
MNEDMGLFKQVAQLTLVEKSSKGDGTLQI